MNEFLLVRIDLIVRISHCCRNHGSGCFYKRLNLSFAAISLG
jgi:hypothetical protein